MIFFYWKHCEESLEEFFDEIDLIHPTIKFTRDLSKEKVNFLDVEVTLKNSISYTDLFVKPTNTHKFSVLTRVICIIVKKAYL